MRWLRIGIPPSNGVAARGVMEWRPTLASRARAVPRSPPPFDGNPFLEPKTDATGIGPCRSAHIFRSSRSRQGLLPWPSFGPMRRRRPGWGTGGCPPTTTWSSAGRGSMGSPRWPRSSTPRATLAWRRRSAFPRCAGRRRRPRRSRPSTCSRAAGSSRASAGSSERDYVVGGVPVQQRFVQFEEAVRALRALLGRDREPFVGRFYSTAGVTLEPPPSQPGRPPIWLAGWGGTRGLRRAARTRRRLACLWLQHDAGGLRRFVGGGPEARGRARRRPRSVRQRDCHPLDLRDRGPRQDRADARRRPRPAPRPRRRVLADALAPDGSAEVCAQRLSAFADAGAERVFVWPLGDDIHQLTLLAERVVPRISGATANDATRDDPPPWLRPSPSGRLPR